ncbi:MAG: organic solvent tolerance protein [Hyphomicrobium sp.]|nr:MAG: organic solvent tolerance protein [Hyphomicrobium sp.]PPC99665.1 MAG: organic solvent tolerance protein [Hyphomicrobium sp.]
MKCATRTPQEGCGLSREGGWRHKAAGLTRAFARIDFTLIAAAAFICTSIATITAPAHAQNTSVTQQDPVAASARNAASSFPEQAGGILGNVNTKIDSTQPLKLQGDQLVYDTAGNRVIARGNVEIFYNNYILTADEVVYDQSAGTLTAVGNVTLKEPQGNVIRADRYTLTDDFRDGFVQSLSVVTRDQSRISAERATRRDGNVTEFTNAKFTPCKSDGATPPLWCLSAARIIHDKDAAVISYQDAYFQIYGQPVLYLPYFQHADPSVKRKSGFLTPEYGQSSNLGFITGIPYYFSLDPSYDVTITPLYLSKQGVLWQGEYRQRLANGQYTIRAAGIDQDADDLPGNFDDNSKFDGWRGTVETKGQFALSSWWKVGWDVTLESDDEFRRFYKLDNILLQDRVNQVYLVGQSDRNYFAARLYHFGGLSFDDTNQAESYTHPIIDHNYVFADPILGGELKVDTNAVSFTRDDGASDGSLDQTVNRIATQVQWRRRLTDQIGITYTPFANLRGDIYQFDNFTDPESVEISEAGCADGNDATPCVTDSSLVDDGTEFRGVAAAGATVTYPWIANTQTASHIIEPIGQIIARQASVTQRRLPDEDARSLVFDDTNLFEVSKFSGYDRIETGTRANVGVQYTFQANNGGYARLLAGQSFHLDGDNVYRNPGRDDTGNFLYTPQSGLENNRSDYVLGAYIAPVDSFRLISQSRFDEEDLTLRREDVTGEISFGPLLAQATYAFSAADPELGFNTDQQDAFGYLKLQLTNFWSIGAGIRYDIDEDQLLSDSLQVRYADDCFVLTATYTELYYNSESIDDDRSLMLRFEFKHLGEFAYKTDTLDFAFGGEQRTD